MENKSEEKKMRSRRVYGGRWESTVPFVNRLRQNAAKEQMRLRLKAAKEAEGGSDKAEGGSDKAGGGSDKAGGGSDKAEGGSDKAESEGASNRNDDDDDSESCTDEEEDDDDVEDDVEDDDDEEYDDDEDPEKRYMEDVSVGYMLGNMIMSSIVQREARDSGK
jgi:hypothetical protein